MTIEEALVGKLLANATLTGIVADRVLPVFLELPERAAAFLPSVVYSLTDYVDEGESVKSASGIRKAIFAVVCASQSYPEVIAMSNAVEAALHWQLGTWGDRPIASVRIASGRDGGESVSDGRVFQRFLEFEIRFMP